MPRANTLALDLKTNKIYLSTTPPGAAFVAIVYGK